MQRERERRENGHARTKMRKEIGNVKVTEEKEELQERGNVCVYVCERDKQSETDRDRE